MASVVGMVRSEREDLASLLTDFSPAQWSRPTLCSQWRVRDLAAHVISYDGLSYAQIAKRRFIDAGGSVDRFNATAIADYADLGTVELVDLIRQRAQPRGYMAAFGGTIGLLDAMIHQQDIRRPLGIARAIPPERLRAALKRSLYVPILCSAWRSRGLQLIATDVDWIHGNGPEVRAPGEALLMSLAGRSAAFAELSGQGTATLLDRLRAERD
jgi:uncharacterized protein (TIGR03083 family)